VPGTAFSTGQPSHERSRCGECRYRATLGERVSSRVWADAVGRRGHFPQAAILSRFLSPSRLRKTHRAGVRPARPRRPGMENRFRTIGRIRNLHQQTVAVPRPCNFIPVGTCRKCLTRHECTNGFYSQGLIASSNSDDSAKNSFAQPLLIDDSCRGPVGAKRSFNPNTPMVLSSRALSTAVESLADISPAEA
jgi:hypothetical protein